MLRSRHRPTSSSADAALARIASLPEVLAGRPDWLARRGDILAAAGRDDEALTAYADALAAIEGLSAKRRTVEVTIALEARLRRLLARDGTGGYARPPDREATRKPPRRVGTLASSAAKEPFFR